MHLIMQGYGNADGNKNHAIQHIKLHTSVLKKFESSEKSPQVSRRPVDQSGFQFIMKMSFGMHWTGNDIHDLVL